MKTAFFVFLLSLSSFTHTVSRSTPTQFQFPESENESGIRESDVWTILFLLDQEYGEQIKNPAWMLGFDWKNPYIAGGSKKNEGLFSILLYGGLVRARFSTLGTVASVICHELGHNLAGPPYQQFPGENPHWSSSEGQADMFVTSDCLPRLYDRLKKQAPHWIEPSNEPSTKALCERSLNPEKCEWVATSAIDMIQMIQVYFDTDQPFANPVLWSKENTTETIHTRYPSYQCRMDIYKAAAADSRSERLRCWYAPN